MSLLQTSIFCVQTSLFHIGLYISDLSQRSGSSLWQQHVLEITYCSRKKCSLCLNIFFILHYLFAVELVYYLHWASSECFLSRNMQGIMRKLLKETYNILIYEVCLIVISILVSFSYESLSDVVCVVFCTYQTSSYLTPKN
jgi:hypothetical protein